MDCNHGWRNLKVSDNMDHPVEFCRSCERFRFKMPRDGWIDEIGDKTIDAHDLVRMFDRRILHFYFGDCGVNRESIDKAIKSGKINHSVLGYFKDNAPKCMWHLSYLMRSIPISENGCLFIYNKKRMGE